MPMQMKIVTIASFAALMSAGVFAGPFVLAERGEAQPCRIALETPSAPSAAYAAEELRDYAERLTGSRPVIVTNATSGCRVAIRCEEGDAERFRLKVEDGTLRISGGARGVLYGVYEVLETYGGVGWFSSWCEVVPRLERLEVPADLDREERPAFALRELHWKDAFEGDFAARLRINGTWHVKTTAKHGRGADFFGAGLGRCHTFDTLIPPQRYFKEHPEYFCEIGGRRSNFKPQPCLTHPEVLRIVTSNLLGRIAGAQDSPYFGVSQNDNANYCRCARCAAVDAEEGSHAGTMVRFVNEVADAVDRAYPDKIVETLAYMYTRKPPKSARYRPNVMPCLCTLECDFSKPLETSRFPENVAFRDDIRGWSEQVRQLYIWDYTTDFSHYLKPFENLKVLQPNLRFFRRMGVKGVFEQGAYQGWHGELAELKVWLMAKWLWNPDLDANALTKRFLLGYYGKAAPQVMEYLKLLYAAERDEAKDPVLIFDSVGKDPVLTDGFFAKATEIWRRAAEAVRDDPIRAYNVRMGAMSVDYTNYMRNFRPVNVSARRRPCDAGLPKRLDAAIREAENAKRPVVFCESWTASASRRRQIAADAEGAGIIGDGQSAVLAESAFTLHAGRDKIEVRTDAAAADGRALWLANDNWEWYAQFDLNRVAFDSDCDYRIRLRVRVDLAGGAGEAFSFGIYDTKAKKTTVRRSVTSGEVKAGYAWYELPPCRLADDQLLWFAPGGFDGAKRKRSPVHDSIWIDRMEISRLADRSAAGASTDLDVRAFGAKGDGVTDDTAAFQAAADAMRNANRKGHRGFGQRYRAEPGGAAEGPHLRLVIPEGRYRLTDKVIFFRDIFIRGEGAVEIVQENPKADAFYCLGAYRTRIENLAFRGGRTQIALPTRNCESANLRILGCRFFGSSAAAIESLSYGDFIGTPRLALPKDRYRMYEAWPKTKGAKYERVSEWNYDRKTDSYFRDPRIDEPQHLVVDYHSSLMTVEDCLFDGCATSVRMHPDGGVIRNCRFLTSPASVGGAVFAWNSLHAYGNEFLLRGDGRRQSAFHCEGRTTFWLESSRIRTEDRSGACVIEGISIPHNQAAQVILDNLDTDTGLGRGNAICRWTHGRFPNIAVVRNVRAEGRNPVEAMAFEPELTDEGACANRHFTNIAPEDSYAFAVGGCSPNVKKPTGYAARFLKEIPADACRTVVDPPEAPHRKGPVFQAEADGVDTDPKTDDTEAMKRFLARLRGNPGSTGVLPAAWITVRDTLPLDGDFSLEGAGVAAFDGGGGADGYFRTVPGADVTLKGLQVCGGTTALTVVSGSRARVDSSFAYDQDAATVRTERGSDFAWDGGVVYSSRFYDGEGRGFIGNVWLRYTPNVPPSEPLKPAAVIVNRGELEIWDLLGVPCVFDRVQKSFASEPAREIYEYRWVDNYGRYHSRAMRYGGEWGGIVPIFHFGKASTSFEGGYAWFWGLSVPHGAVVADSATPDARAFAVVFPGYRKYLTRIEMLYRDRPDRPLVPVPSARLDVTFPLK